MVDRPDLGKYQPSCNLAHGLVNKLAVIVGHCDLLRDEADAGSLREKHLLAIRKIAQQMANDLNQHQCDLEFLASELSKRPAAPVKIDSATSKPA